MTSAGLLSLHPVARSWRPLALISGEMAWFCIFDLGSGLKATQSAGPNTTETNARNSGSKWYRGTWCCRFLSVVKRVQVDVRRTVDGPCGEKKVQASASSPVPMNADLSTTSRAFFFCLALSHIPALSPARRLDLRTGQPGRRRMLVGGNAEPRAPPA